MKRKTNIQIIKGIMETGPMFQLVVVEAVSKYVEEVYKGDAKNYDNAIISGQAWKAICADIRETLMNAYQEKK